MEKEIRGKNGILKSNLDTWVNQTTGEIVQATEITKKVGRNGFMITYLSTIIELLDTLGTKKMKVVKYILQNMDKSNNLLIITTRELAEQTNTSSKTVTETLKLLQDSKIIVRKVGVIMISPTLVHRGNEGKERALLTRFTEIGGEKENE
jgi:DNA-binding transcriptional regulator YhcF (GntR family)